MTLSQALYQAGRLEESAEAFRLAEALRQPEYPTLYSLAAYRYCDLLLSREEPECGSGVEELTEAPEEVRRFRQACQEVQELAEQKIQIAERKHSLLDVALDHLSLGRSHLGLALTAAGSATPGRRAEVEFPKAAEQLDRAVEGLRRAGREDFLPHGLLARSALHRLRGELAEAGADLDEAVEIAERSGMRLYLCDAHLEGARLALRQGDAEAAREHVALARKLVVETGYKRREREVAWLEGRV